MKFFVACRGALQESRRVRKLLSMVVSRAIVFLIVEVGRGLLRELMEFASDSKCQIRWDWQVDDLTCLI